MSIPDAARPVLFFDSGVGGLSILSEFQKLRPDAPLIYAADNAFLPYGEKSERTILTRVPALLGRMVERFKPRIVVIACNTASTIALDAVRTALDLDVVGTVPAIKPASILSQSGVIGLLGTAATVKQSYVDMLESEFATDKRLIRIAAPELVWAAEEKIFKGKADISAIEAGLAGLLNDPGARDMDTIVLACTHFSLISEEIQEITGPSIRLIDGASGIARRTDSLISGQDFKRIGPDFAVFTEQLEDVDAVDRALAKYRIENVIYF